MDDRRGFRRRRGHRSVVGGQRSRFCGRDERAGRARAADPSRDSTGPIGTSVAGRDHQSCPRSGFGRSLIPGVGWDLPASISARRLCEGFLATTSSAPAATGMSLDANASVLTSRTFRAMGTLNVVAVDDPDALAPATAAAREVIHAVDEACSRFRPDSEISMLNRSAGYGPVRVSELLDDVIGNALWAAAATEGLVDPTIGGLMERIGYTVTFVDLPADGPAIDLQIRSAPGWASIEHDRVHRTVTLPEGASIDLGAIGKAWAADRAALAASRRAGTGVLVSCGGDVAVSGPGPKDGWCVRVAEAIDSADWQDIHVFDGGVATSGSGSRTWRRGGEVLHHILDPATGLPSDSPWVMASVAAASCAQANAAATASIVLGEGAPSWLDSLGVPARLVRRDGSIVRAGRWPA
ncbi:MAG: FAD:protein FMN transferase [Candidatus Dormiibacterota bacterium]